jgi:hypothetical protein
MIEASRTHLRDAGETYFEHMAFALTVGLLAAGAGLACMIHAIVPGACQRTCSRTLSHLQQLFADRDMLPRTRSESQGVLVFAGLCLLAAMTALPLLILTGASSGALGVAALSFAFPAAFVCSNPELHPA